MNFRFLAKILLLISVFFLPFWVTLILYFLSVLFLKDFYFGIFSVFILDLVYGVKNIQIGYFPGFVFLLSIISFYVVLVLKKFINLKNLDENL